MILQTGDIVKFLSDKGKTFKGQVIDSDVAGIKVRTLKSGIEYIVPPNRIKLYARNPATTTAIQSSKTAHMMFNVGDEVEVAGKNFFIQEIDWIAPSGPFYKLNDQTWVNATALKPVKSSQRRDEAQDFVNHNKWREPKCVCGAHATTSPTLHSNWCDRYGRD